VHHLHWRAEPQPAPCQRLLLLLLLLLFLLLLLLLLLLCRCQMQGLLPPLLTRGLTLGACAAWMLPPAAHPPPNLQQQQNKGLKQPVGVQRQQQALQRLMGPAAPAGGQQLRVAGLRCGCSWWHMLLLQVLQRLLAAVLPVTSPVWLLLALWWLHLHLLLVLLLLVVRWQQHCSQALQFACSSHLHLQSAGPLCRVQKEPVGKQQLQQHHPAQPVGAAAAAAGCCCWKRRACAQHWLCALHWAACCCPPQQLASLACCWVCCSAGPVAHPLLLLLLLWPACLKAWQQQQQQLPLPLLGQSACSGCGLCWACDSLLLLLMLPHGCHGWLCGPWKLWEQPWPSLQQQQQQ
jgi:hypothetical protein